MARRKTSIPTPRPVALETLFFVSAAVTILGQGGALGVRAIHFYALAADAEEARGAFLTNMQSAPFAYQVTDIIVTGITRDVLIELVQGQDRGQQGAQVWH